MREQGTGILTDARAAKPHRDPTTGEVGRGLDAAPPADQEMKRLGKQRRDPNHSLRGQRGGLDQRDVGLAVAKQRDILLAACRLHDADRASDAFLEARG